MKARKANENICLGVIVGAHGIKGEVKVRSWTAADRDIGAYGTLCNKDGQRLFELKVVGRGKDFLRCKIKGVDDRNEAEMLVGTELYVKRAALPDLADEEYYQADLIGLSVCLESSGEEIGEVAGVYNFGAGDILEIRLKDTNRLEMIPFNRQYVPQILFAQGRLTVSAEIVNFAPDDKETDHEG